MAQAGLAPDLAIVSTARRAQETWELARTAFIGEIAQQNDRRIYEASAGAILDVIKETDPGMRALLVVGHNPGLEELAVGLIGTARKSDLARLRQKFPTGGLVEIAFDAGNWARASMGGGRLERFETPKSVG